MQGDDCGSGLCGCTDPQCMETEKVCTSAACTCHYGPMGACTTPLQDGYGDDACTQGNACFNGTCHRATLYPCNADAECGSGHCACANTICQGRRCSPIPCSCQWTDGSGTCEGNIVDGIMDPEHCV